MCEVLEKYVTQVLDSDKDISWLLKYYLTTELFVIMHDGKDYCKIETEIRKNK